MTTTLLEMPKLKYGVAAKDILTEDEQNEIIMWRDVFTRGQFRIGRMAAKKIAGLASRGIVISDEDVDAAFGSFVGKTPRTVRYWRETATFYNSSVEQEFETLPFSHFVFAKSLGDRWHEVLEYAMSYPGISAEGLKAVFMGDVASNYISPEPAKEEVSEVSPDNDPVEKYKRTLKTSAINSFAVSLDRFAEIVSKSANIHDDTKAVVLDALKTLRRYMPELLKA